MIKIKPSFLILLMLALGVTSVGGALWFLSTPGNPFSRQFRGAMTQGDANIIIGPYPLPEDFQVLKRNGVGLVVTLLDPSLPYENILLHREMRTAQELGMRVKNFPMMSIFGKRFGTNTEDNAAAAARAIAGEPTKVYLHCYLGLHRVKVVEALLQAMGKNTQQYGIRHTFRSEDIRRLDKAQSFFDSNQYPQALVMLKALTQSNAQSQLLQGWCYYHLDQVEESRKEFAAIVRDDPTIGEAVVGLGYCAFKEKQWKEAETYFTQVLDKNPKDAAALAGIGLTFSSQGRRPEAISYLERSLQIDPHNPEASELLKTLRLKK